MHVHNTIVNKLPRIGVNLSVCLSVTDVTSLPQRVLWERSYQVYSNAYAGNESPKTVGAVDMVSFIAP